MTLSRSKLIISVTTLVTLSTLSLFSACGKKKSGPESASASTGAGDVPIVSNEEKKKQEEGRELMAYVYKRVSPQHGNLRVMTSKGKEVLTANHVENGLDVEVAGSVIAYKTTDPSTRRLAFHVFNRDGKELFNLNHYSTQKRVEEINVSNTFVAVYNHTTHKLTVYDLQGQFLVDDEDAEDDYRISDTLIAYQTPAHKLIVKDTSGTSLIEQDLEDLSGEYTFTLMGSLFSFQPKGSAKAVVYNEKVQLVSAAAPSIFMLRHPFYVLQGEQTPAKELKNLIVMDSSGKELKRIPSCYDISLSKEHIAMMDHSKLWTVTNFAGDNMIFGPIPVVQKIVLREHFFLYFSSTSVIMKSWEGKELANAVLHAPGGKVSFDTVRRSNEMISYIDQTGKRVILNYEGKQLVDPLDDATVILPQLF